MTVFNSGRVFIHVFIHFLHLAHFHGSFTFPADELEGIRDTGALCDSDGSKSMDFTLNDSSHTSNEPESPS